MLHEPRWRRQARDLETNTAPDLLHDDLRQRDQRETPPDSMPSDEEREDVSPKRMAATTSTCDEDHKYVALMPPELPGETKQQQLAVWWALNSPAGADDEEWWAATARVLELAATRKVPVGPQS